MWPVSDRWKQAIRQDHTKVDYVDLYLRSEPVALDIPLLSGQVTDDSQANFRRRCNLTFPGTAEVLALLPQSPGPDVGLWPLGTELHVRSGIRYDDGTEETVPMGLFRVSKPTLVDGPSGFNLVVDGYDRSRAISRNRFTRPYIVAASVAGGVDEENRMHFAIRKLIKDRLPFMTDDMFIMADYIEGGYGIPAMAFIKDDDPWECVQRMAAAMGAEVRFLGNGYAEIREIPKVHNQPVVASFLENEEAILIQMGRSIDDEQAYNGVVVVGENSNNVDPETGVSYPPVLGQAWDTDPDSPTYYDPAYPELSTYGAVPYFYSSQYIYNEEQARLAAEGLLQQNSGVMENIEFGGICDPSLESTDVIQLANERMGISTLCILDSITFGLGADSNMAGATRRRRVIVGGESGAEAIVFGTGPNEDGVIIDA